MNVIEINKDLLIVLLASLSYLWALVYLLIRSITFSYDLDSYKDNPIIFKLFHIFFPIAFIFLGIYMLIEEYIVPIILTVKRKLINYLNRIKKLI